jgi:hypothetical protein
MLKMTLEKEGSKKEHIPRLCCSPKGSVRIFDIMFLRDDEDQTVEVVESSMIDFKNLIEQLGQGNSVFIAPKKVPCLKPTKKHRSNHSGSLFMSRI